MNNKKLTEAKLTKEEKKLEKALSRGEFVQASDFRATKKLFEEAARNHLELNKSKRISIRIKQEDLIRVKAKAKKNNIPYQTLLNALIRQFANGQTKVEL